MDGGETDDNEKDKDEDGDDHEDDGGKDLSGRRMMAKEMKMMMALRPIMEEEAKRRIMKMMMGTRTKKRKGKRKMKRMRMMKRTRNYHSQLPRRGSEAGGVGRVASGPQEFVSFWSLLVRQ